MTISASCRAIAAALALVCVAGATSAQRVELIAAPPAEDRAPPRRWEPATGPMRTFDQHEWARACDVSPAGCLRDLVMVHAFPRGLVVGGEPLALTLSNADAVAAALPKTGTPKVLAASHVDPVRGTRGTGGAFAGQVIAARLNVAAADLALLPAHASGHVLGELQLTGDIAPRLRGRSVRALLDLADDCLSGRLGFAAEEDEMAARRLDLDGDGVGDTSLLDVHDAVRDVNRNHDGKGVDRGRLCPPDSASPPRSIAPPRVITRPGGGDVVIQPGAPVVPARPIVPGGGIDPVPRTDPVFEIRPVPEERLKPFGEGADVSGADSVGENAGEDDGDGSDVDGGDDGDDGDADDGDGDGSEAGAPLPG